MGTMLWIAVAGQILLSILAFLAGHSLETRRIRRLLRLTAIERRDLEDRRAELQAQSVDTGRR
ncbi:MAG: hypothetical protein ACRDSR_12155 [Pseudonocardiaceae bacterium]